MASRSELQRLEDLDPAGHGGEGGHQRAHEEQYGNDQQQPTRIGEWQPGVRTALIVGRCRGPLLSGPLGHRFGRRWKKPHRQTTASVPMGMAKVSA